MLRGNRSNSTLGTRIVLHQEISGIERDNGSPEFTYANSLLSGAIRRRNVITVKSISHTMSIYSHHYLTGSMNRIIHTEASLTTSIDIR